MGRIRKHIQPSVSTSLGRLAMISSVAGTGRPAVEFSASWVNIWSNALGWSDGAKG